MSKDRDGDGVFAGNDVPEILRDQDDNDPTIGAPKASTELGSGYSGQGAATEPYASVTSIAEATADFNAAFTTMFGTKPPKSLMNAYASELIALQSGRSNKPTKTKSGTNIVVQGVSAQERQNILNKYLTQHANVTIDAAQAGDVKAQAALQKGNFGVTYTTLKNAYYENGLPFNVKSLAKLTAESAITPEKLKANLNLINLQAKTYFPALADKIDKGYTVKQLLSPYIQTRANILEEDPDAVDVASLKNVASDPKGLMGLYDYEVSLRQDPKWRFTKNAQDSLSSVASGIAKTFGLVG